MPPPPLDPSFCWIEDVFFLCQTDHPERKGKERRAPTPSARLRKRKQSSGGIIETKREIFLPFRPSVWVNECSEQVRGKNE
mmetsp:Transcript_44596/g.88142  ORF Transcript_44596/g.88142 Transcript_44596/m.88142 type:complete len:81 (+) Transcript_44596:227-469(+)